MDAFTELVLQAITLGDEDSTTLEDAALDAVSGADAETQAKAAAALLAAQAHQHTPWGAVLADALAEAVRLRAAHDVRLAADDAEPETAAAYRAYAAGERPSPRGGWIGWGNRPR